MHDAEQRAPIDEPAAGELAGKPIANANVVGAHEHVAHFIEPTPAGPAKQPHQGAMTVFAQRIESNKTAAGLDRFVKLGGIGIMRR
jgi:hypothetical protein